MICFIEPFVDSTSSASVIFDLSVIKIIQIVCSINATSDGNDDFVLARVISTISLGFVCVIIEGLNVLHLRVSTAGFAVPAPDNILLTIGNSSELKEILP